MMRAFGRQIKPHPALLTTGSERRFPAQRRAAGDVPGNAGVGVDRDERSEELVPEVGIEPTRGVNPTGF